jgi:hypothetical protein
MKARFMIENPDDIEATMKITMSIKDWVELKDQLGDKWPSSDLYSKITDLIIQARKVFYTSNEN